MNEKLLQLLDGREDLYPHNLEERFSRVLNRIVQLWNLREIDDYFSELMIDNRGGNRQGFPREVVSELIALSLANTRAREKREKAGAGNPWDNVEEAKRTAVEEQGYAFSPRGFAQSAEKGDRKAIQLFLDSGVDINTRDEHGWTPLMISTFNGREDVALLLIRSGANVNAKDKSGYGPMHWAAFKGYTSVIKLLIERRATVNAISTHGLTPLLQAATRGHLPATAQLIDAGANVNLASHDGWTPLHKAAANGHIEVVKLLLSKGAFPKSESVDGKTPLEIASKNKHREIVRLLKASS